MKYHIAYAIAWTVERIDDKVFGHAERWFPLWTRVPYPLCRWSYSLQEWAAEMCCDVGCVRCS
jgi:hypothetical protein